MAQPETKDNRPEAKAHVAEAEKPARPPLHKRFLQPFVTLGGFALFGGRFLKRVWAPPYEFKEVVRQLNEVGFRSLGLVSVVSVVIGAVLTMQTRPTMMKFGAEGFVPAMVAISVMRELAPVVISIIVGGRVGAGIGAELGSMRASEQIDAMEVAALDPFKLLVVTRVLACMIALPLLTIFADFLALFGSYLVGRIEAGVTFTLFKNSVLASITFADYLPGVIKTVFFGFIIGIVGCYEGFNSSGGTEGVGKSATDAVVSCSLLIIVTDALFVKISLLFGK
jgi:phospholipid/cholesterol/gamma-HCH transport system permease protein